MFDAKIRPIIDPPLNRWAARIVKTGINANHLTLTGLFLCLPLFLCLAAQYYFAALLFVILNRLIDGLDGPVARHSQSGATDFGGYLDIVADFVFYSGFVFFFGVGWDVHLPAVSFLLFSFFASATSFLAYAIIAEKRGISTNAQGKKSFFYMAGLAEGSETIATFVLMCLIPSFFSGIAAIFGLMCWVTAFGRIMQARKIFTTDPASSS